MVKNTTCDRCGLNLSTYQKYQQHLNRKNPCRPKNLPQAPIPVQNAGNVIPEQNLPPAPESDLISFDETPPILQPTQPREASAPAVDLLTGDIPNTEARPSSRIQPNREEKRSQFLTID